jgi:D-beta-D-heptose 7-phosphate kinase/D-beta-D-heptose 1-phosphate adenosyltransferase
MSKITGLKNVIEISREARSRGRKIGLITGCFDILHLGHIELIRFAKKHVDVLIVGLENDETVRLSKGPDRPVHNLTQRSEVLSELQSVDNIFPIPITVKFADQADIRGQYVELVGQIHPDFLITSPSADKYWSQKRDSLQPLGIGLLECPQTQDTSTTSVLAHIQKEI